MRKPKLEHGHPTSMYPESETETETNDRMAATAFWTIWSTESGTFRAALAAGVPMLGGPFGSVPEARRWINDRLEGVTPSEGFRVQTAEFYTKDVIVVMGQEGKECPVKK